jgi:N-acetylglucosamine-6-sulfatase
MKSSNIFVCAAILMLAISGLFQKLQAQNKRPNFIIVLVDDLRWDEFGLGGHNYIKTPNIDRIVREGGRFTNAFSTTPLCSPSRASFLTGQYAYKHGIVDNKDRSPLSHQLKTFPQQLNKEGYATAFIGKWHMGNDNTPRPGFDFWAVLKGQGEANDPEFNKNGKDTAGKGYVTDLLTDYSLEFINQERKKPFLLYLSHKGLHPNIHQDATGKVTDIGEGGFVAADRHQGMYSNQVFKRRPNAFVTPRDKPALMRKIANLPDLGKGTATSEQTIRERAEMLMSIDEGFGKIVAQLEKTGELDNTVIVFTSDHGYWYGEHGLNEERRLAYEEGIRIPLLIRYPTKIKAGTRYSDMVLNIDLAPTIIEMAGGRPDGAIQGKSMVPILENRQQKPFRSSFLIEYNTDSVWPRTVNMGYKAIRTDRYKYIRYNELEGMDEFYDLKKDPFELNNLIGQTSYKAKIGEAKRLLDEYNR